MSNWGLNISRDRDSTIPVGNLFQVVITVIVKKLFQMFTWNFPYMVSGTCSSWRQILPAKTEGTEHLGPSANQEGWSLSLEVIPETQWTLLDPILSRSISCRIPPSRSLSRPKSAALQSSVVILILRCSILSGPWTPPSHSHYSEGCPQSSHPWTVLPCLSVWGQALTFSSSALWSFLSGSNNWCTL